MRDYEKGQPEGRAGWATKSAPGSRPHMLQHFGVVEFSSSAFDPTQVAGLKLWLDPGLGLTAGVSWLDQSGTGDANKNMTGANWPTLNASDAAFNHQPTLSFNGALSQNLKSGTWAAALAQPETIFIVGDFDGVAVNEYMSDGGGNNERVIFNNSGVSEGAIFAGAVLDSGLALVSAPMVVAASFNASTSKIWISQLTANASGSSGGVTTRTGLTLGSSGAGGVFLTGKIAAVIIYGAALSNTDFAKVMQYLGTKYGITIGA